MLKPRDRVNRRSRTVRFFNESLEKRELLSIASQTAIVDADVYAGDGNGTNHYKQFKQTATQIAGIADQASINASDPRDNTSATTTVSFNSSFTNPNETSGQVSMNGSFASSGPASSYNDPSGDYLFDYGIDIENPSSSSLRLTVNYSIIPDTSSKNAQTLSLNVEGTVITKGSGSLTVPLIFNGTGLNAISATMQDSASFNSANIKGSSSISFTWSVGPPLPDLSMESATTTDAKTVTSTYDVYGANITQPLTFNIYRSSSSSGYTAADLIGTDTLATSDVADLSIGHHVVKLAVSSGAILPDPSHEYVYIVANPNQSFQESNYSNDSAYFRIFELGAISHGLMDPWDGSPSGIIPLWESTMVATLKAGLNNGGEGFDDVIAFNWTTSSNTPLPGEAVAAGTQLALSIAAEASEYEDQHTGNVVDLDLIGHSRGTVVVSQAVQYLATHDPSTIKGSYISLNLLDPHPAANVSTFDNYASTSQGAAGAAMAAVLYAAQATYRDPAITIPSVVNSVRVYFQQTPADLFPNTDIDSQGNINLWGHGNDGTIINQSVSPITYVNLTDYRLNGVGYIGHGQVPLYYLDYVINVLHSG